MITSCKEGGGGGGGGGGDRESEKLKKRGWKYDAGAGLLNSFMVEAVTIKKSVH